MLAPHLRLVGRHDPLCSIEVEFTPLRVAKFRWAYEYKGENLKCRDCALVSAVSVNGTEQSADGLGLREGGAVNGLSCR